MQYTLQQVGEAFKKAPPGVQQALQSEEVGGQFATIAGAFDLSEEQFSEFVDETGLLLLGLTPQKNYESNLALRLRSPELARSVAERGHAEIVAPVMSGSSGKPALPIAAAPTTPAVMNRPTFAAPETSAALERLEETREKAILTNVHQEKLGGMVSNGTSVAAGRQQPPAPEKPSGDPYREAIE